jgi:hypothetical protein
MTNTQTHAWIFLSVSESPASLQDVIAMADAINHAIPTDKELQVSLGWLRANGLIQKEGRRYSLTPSGLALRTETSRHLVMKSWDAVTRKFTEMESHPTELDDISPKEAMTAYEAYRERFKAAYKKLTENEK